MSLLDNVRQTLSDVADNVVDSTRQISAQTQLQLAMKKLQLERAKRIHELGKQAFAWYQSGSLQVSGAVPADVTDACRQLEDIERQLSETERSLEEARQEAAQKGASGGSTITVSATPVPDPNAHDPNAPAYQPPPYVPPAPPYPPQGAYPPPPPHAPPAYPPQGPPPNYQYPPQPSAPPPPAGHPPSHHATVVLPDPDNSPPHPNSGGRTSGL